MANSIDNTIKTVEGEAEENKPNEEVSETKPEESKEEKVEEPKAEPKKKTSLQGLLDSAKKLKK